ncbi:MAG TPA: MoaD/ThiS family protein [Aliidongia sp.]|nr:MoaD/ThiS family protein [Aliidongia sp.]
MPRVLFTAHLKRLAPAGPVWVEAGTVRAALDRVFAEHPLLRSYVLDEQARLRKHVVLFVDGNRAALDDPVAPAAELCVLQALSGG